MRFPDFTNELLYIEKSFLVAGCDEVGRGPVAGPVVACVCVLKPETIEGERTEDKWYFRVRDSKTIKEEEREELAEKIKENSRAFGIGIVEEAEIDEINIHNATLKAMRLAVEDLLNKLKPKEKVFIFIDGSFKIPGLDIEQKNIIKGDSKVLSIASASIIAKVHRDNIMKTLHEKFPEYGFLNHKGYGTRAHQEALKKLGITPAHRKSFLKSFI